MLHVQSLDQCILVVKWPSALSPLAHQQSLENKQDKLPVNSHGRHTSKHVMCASEFVKFNSQFGIWYVLMPWGNPQSQKRACTHPHTHSHTHTPTPTHSHMSSSSAAKPAPPSHDGRRGGCQRRWCERSALTDCFRGFLAMDALMLMLHWISVALRSLEFAYQLPMLQQLLFQGFAPAHCSVVWFYSFPLL